MAILTEGQASIFRRLAGEQLAAARLRTFPRKGETADCSIADRKKKEAPAETHEAKFRLTKDNGALLFRLHELLLRFTLVDDEGVIVAELRPGTGRNFGGLDKFPISHIGVLQT